MKYNLDCPAFQKYKVKRFFCRIREMARNALRGPSLTPQVKCKMQVDWRNARCAGAMCERCEDRRRMMQGEKWGASLNLAAVPWYTKKWLDLALAGRKDSTFVNKFKMIGNECHYSVIDEWIDEGE